MSGPDGPSDDAGTTVTVPALLAGERLDRALSTLLEVSRSEVATWITDGRVRVDGTVVRTRSAKVADGAAIEVPRPRLADGHTELVAEPEVAIEVVHVDDDVIVVDKPPGLVVHPGAGHRTGTLVQGLLARYPEIASVGPDPDRPGIVHRIDKDTSGLLMVARTPDAYDDLVAQLQARVVEREYVALLWGRFDVGAGMVDGGIGRSRRDPTKMAVAAAGKPARTRYEVVDTFAHPVEVSLVRCRLLSGRTHQIRVHMQSIGHAVVGDTTYGGARQSFPVPRMFLHAARLGFVHPRSGEELRFDSALPADLDEALARLS